MTTEIVEPRDPRANALVPLARWEAAERLAVLVLDMGPPKDEIDTEAGEMAHRVLGHK